LERQKKKKKKKGLAAFMEDEQEMEELKKEKTEVEEVKAEKGVRFGENQVKEFNKHERIVEVSQTLSAEEVERRKEVIMREK